MKRPVAVLLAVVVLAAAGIAVAVRLSADEQGARSALAAVDRFVAAVLEGDQSEALDAVTPGYRDEASMRTRIDRWRGLSQTAMHVEVAPSEPSKFMQVRLRFRDRPELDEDATAVHDRKGWFVTPRR